MSHEKPQPLREEQMDQVMDYIKSHRTEFEAEYQEVARKCAERERFWREREEDSWPEVMTGVSRCRALVVHTQSPTTKPALAV